MWTLNELELYYFTSLVNRLSVLTKLLDFLSQYILLAFKGIFFLAGVKGRKEPLFLHGYPYWDVHSEGIFIWENTKQCRFYRNIFRVLFEEEFNVYFPQFLFSFSLSWMDFLFKFPCLSQPRPTSAKVSMTAAPTLHPLHHPASVLPPDHLWPPSDASSCNTALQVSRLCCSTFLCPRHRIGFLRQASSFCLLLSKALSPVSQLSSRRTSGQGSVWPRQLAVALYAHLALTLPP